MRDKDEFDLGSFMITCMALLTGVGAVFAVVLGSRVSQTNAEIRREVESLKNMDRIAQDAPFRDWIARERDNKNQPGGTAADFKALLNDHSRKLGLAVRETAELGVREHPGGTKELSFRMRIEGVKLEALTRFLVSIEEDWPGAKAREIPELNLDEKSQTWTASVVLAIFKAASS